jgi:hypothetical protein
MLLRNYGLFWRRDNVFWGRQKNAGHLKGRSVNSVNSNPVDFREQVGLYALYDDNFKLIYFGQAGRGEGHKLFNRLKDHKNDRIADRWTRFSWFGTRYVKKDGKLSADKDGFQGSATDVLDHIEAVVLAVSEPPHNRQGGRFGAKVEMYRQYRDEDSLGIDEKGMIAEVYKQIVLDTK